jgi:hypothetical protein
MRCKNSVLRSNKLVQNAFLLLILTVSIFAIIPVEASLDPAEQVTFDMVYAIEETRYFGYSGESHYSSEEIFDVTISRDTLNTTLADLTIHGYPLWIDVYSIEENESLEIGVRTYLMSNTGDFWEGWTTGLYRAAESDMYVYYDLELGFLESVMKEHILEGDETWTLYIQLAEYSLEILDEFRNLPSPSYDTTDVFLIGIVGIEVAVIIVLIMWRRTKSLE